MEKILEGKTIAVLIDEGVDQDEFASSIIVLKEAGAKIGIVSAKRTVTSSNDETEQGSEFTAHALLDKVSPEIFDGLFIPGGVYEAENLRSDLLAISFVRHFISSGKPIAATSYGQWILIEADGVKNRYVTSAPVIKEDFIQAGAKWRDEKIVTDRNLLTCQDMEYMPPFIEQLLKLFSQSDELAISALNKEASNDARLNLHGTDPIGENPSKKWGVSEMS